jgi:hypothetical protein
MVMSTLLKYWQGMLQMVKDELESMSYDWQMYIMHTMMDEQKKLEKKLNKIRQGHIWRNSTENQRGGACKEIKHRCNDIKHQHFFSNLREKR